MRSQFLALLDMFLNHVEDCLGLAELRAAMQAAIESQKRRLVPPPRGHSSMVALSAPITTFVAMSVSLICR